MGMRVLRVSGYSVSLILTHSTIWVNAKGAGSIYIVKYEKCNQLKLLHEVEPATRTHHHENRLL
jgi:hypothetical protein